MNFWRVIVSICMCVWVTWHEGVLYPLQYDVHPFGQKIRFPLVSIAFFSSFFFLMSRVLTLAHAYFLPLPSNMASLAMARCFPLPGSPTWHQGNAGCVLKWLSKAGAMWLVLFTACQLAMCCFFRIHSFLCCVIKLLKSCLFALSSFWPRLAVLKVSWNLSGFFGFFHFPPYYCFA